MQTTFALAALAAVAYARPQGVTESIAPQADAPAGCSASHSGSFQIQAVNFTDAASKAKRDSSCGSEGTLTLTLADGTLLDAQGRTGYIASNYQFQFDKPAQTGAIYTSGFTTCSNGSLALGGSAVWYQCYSGGFYNLYDRYWAAQCSPILLNLLPCSGSTSASSGAGQSNDPQGSQQNSAQIQAATAVAAVSQIPDGQPQAASAVAPVSQIPDGQPQAASAVAAAPSPATPIAQITDGQIQIKPTSSNVVAPVSSAAAPVAQITDGQIQVKPTSSNVVAPVSSAAAPVAQITDGQIQVKPTSSNNAVAPVASTASPVAQISDGQIQVKPTNTGSVVTPVTTSVASPSPSSQSPVAQSSGGQVQVKPSSSSSPVSNSTSTSAPLAGSAPALKASLSGLIIAAITFAFL